MTNAFSTNAGRQRKYWETDTAHRPIDHPVVADFAKQRWRYIDSVLPLDGIGTALDVGGGSGFSSWYGPAHVKFVASDLSPGMLARHPGRYRVRSNAIHLPFSDSAFDLVFCWEVLHHIEEPWRVLAEMRRVTRRRVLIFEPNPLNIAQTAFALVDREHRWVLRFSKKYLLGQIRKAGLSPVLYQRGGIIFPNKTPLILSPLLKRIPFQLPLIGISQLVIAEKNNGESAVSD